LNGPGSFGTEAGVLKAVTREQLRATLDNDKERQREAIDLVVALFCCPVSPFSRYLVPALNELPAIQRLNPRPALLQSGGSSRWRPPISWFRLSAATTRECLQRPHQRSCPRRTERLRCLALETSIVASDLTIRASGSKPDALPSDGTPRESSVREFPIHKRGENIGNHFRARNPEQKPKENISTWHVENQAPVTGLRVIDCCG